MNSLAVIGVPSGLQYRALAFVDDDKVEEIRRVVAEVGRRFAVLIFATAHEGLEDGEEHGGVFRHRPLLLDLSRFDAHQGIFANGTKIIEGLIGQHVAICQKQDARTLARLAPGLQAPFALEQLPQAVWKAMQVLPVPVASVSSTRCSPRAMASSALLMAFSW